MSKDIPVCHITSPKSTQTVESDKAPQAWLFTSTTCESCDPVAVAINRPVNWKENHDSLSQKFGFGASDQIQSSNPETAREAFRPVSKTLKFPIFCYKNGSKSTIFIGFKPRRRIGTISAYIITTNSCSLVTHSFAHSWILLTLSRPLSWRLSCGVKKCTDS